LATHIIELADGVRVEAVATDDSIDTGVSGRIDKTVSEIEPTLKRVSAPVVAAWKALNRDMRVEAAEIEIGFGFEMNGNIFVASSKANVSILVKLTLKPL
jgi:hypothetical protein